MKYILPNQMWSVVFFKWFDCTLSTLEMKQLPQCLSGRQETKKNLCSQELPSERSLEPGLQEQAKEPGKLIQLT